MQARLQAQTQNHMQPPRMLHQRSTPSSPSPSFFHIVDGSSDVSAIPPDKVDVVLRPSDPHSPAQVLRVSLKDPIRILKMSIMGSEGILFPAKDLCFLCQGMTVNDSMAICDLPGVKGGSRIILDVFLRSGIPLTLPPLDNPALGSKIVVVDNGLSHTQPFTVPRQMRGSFTDTATRSARALPTYHTGIEGPSPRKMAFFSPRTASVNKQMNAANMLSRNAASNEAGGNRDVSSENDEDEGMIEVELAMSGDDSPDEDRSDPIGGKRQPDPEPRIQSAPMAPKMHLTVIPSGDASVWRSQDPSRGPTQGQSPTTAFPPQGHRRAQHHSTSNSAFYSPRSPSMSSSGPPTPVSTATHTPSSAESFERRRRRTASRSDSNKDSEYSSGLSTAHSDGLDEEGVVSVEIESEDDDLSARGNSARARLQRSHHQRQPQVNYRHVFNQQPQEQFLDTQRMKQEQQDNGPNSILTVLQTVLETYTRDKEAEAEEIQRYQMLVEDLQYELTTLQQQQRYHRWLLQQEREGPSRYGGRDGKRPEASEKTLQADLMRAREEAKLEKAEFEKMRQLVDEAEGQTAKLAEALQQRNDLLHELEAENADLKQKWQSMQSIVAEVK